MIKTALGRPEDPANPLVTETLRDVSRLLRPATARDEPGGRPRVVSETYHDASGRLHVTGWAEDDLLHDP